MKKVIFLNRVNRSEEMKAFFIDIADGSEVIKGHDGKTELVPLTETIENYLNGDFEAGKLLLDGTNLLPVYGDLFTAYSKYVPHLISQEYLKSIYDELEENLNFLYSIPFEELDSHVTKLNTSMGYLNYFNKLEDDKVVIPNRNMSFNPYNIYRDTMEGMFITHEELIMIYLGKLEEINDTINEYACLDSIEPHINSILSVLTHETSLSDKRVEIKLNKELPTAMYFMESVLSGHSIAIPDCAPTGEELTYAFDFTNLISDEYWGANKDMIKVKLDAVIKNGYIASAKVV